MEKILRRFRKMAPSVKMAEEPFIPEMNSARSLKSPFLFPATFLFILLSAAFFRFYSLNWDHSHHFHPDERNIVGSAASLKKEDGFRVRFFAYGQLLTYLYRFTAEVLSVPNFFNRMVNGDRVLTFGCRVGYWLSLAGLIFLATIFLGRRHISFITYALSMLFSLAVFSITLGSTFLIWLSELPWLAYACLQILFIPLCFVSWKSPGTRTACFVMSMLALMALLPKSEPAMTSYDSIELIGRYWSAFFSTLTVPITFLLVQRLYQHRWMALLASAFVAFSVLPIQIAHYCISESFITLMGLVVIWASHQMALDGRWKSYLLVGFCFGVALAAKTSASLLIFPILVAHLVFLDRYSKSSGVSSPNFSRIWHRAMALAIPVIFWGMAILFTWFLRRTIQDLFHTNPVFARHLWIAVLALVFLSTTPVAIWALFKVRMLQNQLPFWLRLSVCGMVAFGVFFLLSPWSLLDWEHFRESMNYEWSVVSRADVVYTFQFKDTPRYLYQLKNLMTVGLGLPLGLLCLTATVFVGGQGLWHVIRATRDTWFSDLLLLSWFIPYFLFVGSWNTKFMRYMVPLVPFFCIFAASFSVQSLAWLKSRLQGAHALGALALTFVLIATFSYSVAYMNVYRNLHPWFQASAWIYRNVPDGAFILTEHWDDGLPTGIDTRIDLTARHSLTPARYRSESLTIYELHGYPTDDSVIKKNYYVEMLQKADYVTISTKKLWYTLVDSTPQFRPDGFNRYPVTSRYYRLLWSGQLGFTLVADFKNSPKLFNFEWNDDDAEETFSVYDHPHAYIFKKTTDVAPDKMMGLLSTDEFVKKLDRSEMLKLSSILISDPASQHGLN